MEYTKSKGGKYVNAEEVENGARVKILDEVTKQESNFKNDKGETKTENVGKVQIEGKPGAFNMRFNWTTIYALIDAFGKESSMWVGKVLTLQKREMLVGDKVRDVMYLIPEGFQLTKDEEKRLVIRKIGGVSEPIYPDVDIDPEDIPF